MYRWCKVPRPERRLVLQSPRELGRRRMLLVLPQRQRHLELLVRLGQRAPRLSSRVRGWVRERLVQEEELVLVFLGACGGVNTENETE